MTIDDIRKILVVGTGTMGQKIALQCARYGYEVVAYDAVPKSLENAKGRIPAFAADLVARGTMKPEESEAAIARIRYSSDPRDGADADLVSESIFEDPDLKAKVFAQLNALCKPQTVFTTNTSTLLPSMYAEATGRPDRFAALHFLGVIDHRLVDIMPHPGTAPEIVELLTAFARRIRQVPLVLKKENPGYVSNAIWGAMNSAAIRISLVDKVASVEDVDRAVMIHLGMPCGPFGLNDQIGLDTIWHVMQSNAKLSGDPGAQAFADEFKRDYIDKGWLGAKSGRGFYTYPDPAYLRPGFLDGNSE
ncbi:MAG TPA: 3-hydroxyacyl-CoA dehydrogenase NAD-binding domain-containing protein [Acidobacteriota bacterium]|nr:3-hydroxyacyl-CoA dehydrogenase NAD-binding domain-containing protein [Acidobacteriota bacterium]HQM63394.1 3-hydroxyacyl-CoA dehydrogenase NAD-binding domain-containing protein [Acidobacteriota bacterium]